MWAKIEYFDDDILTKSNNNPNIPKSKEKKLVTLKYNALQVYYIHFEEREKEILVQYYTYYITRLNITHQQTTKQRKKSRIKTVESKQIKYYVVTLTKKKILCRIYERNFELYSIAMQQMHIHIHVYFI